MAQRVDHKRKISIKQTEVQRAAEEPTIRRTRLDDLSDSELLLLFERFEDGKDVASISSVSKRWKRLAAQVPALSISTKANATDVIFLVRGKTALQRLKLPIHTAFNSSDNVRLGLWSRQVPKNQLKELTLVAQQGVQGVRPGMLVSIASAFPQLETLKFEMGCPNANAIAFPEQSPPFNMPKLHTLHIPKASGCIDFLPRILLSCPVLKELAIGAVIPRGKPLVVNHETLETLLLLAGGSVRPKLVVRAPNLRTLDINDVAHVTAEVSPDLEVLGTDDECITCNISPLPTKLKTLYASIPAKPSLLLTLRDIINNSAATLTTFDTCLGKSPFRECKSEFRQAWRAIQGCVNLKNLSVCTSHLSINSLDLSHLQQLTHVWLIIPFMDAFLGGSSEGTNAKANANDTANGNVTAFAYANANVRAIANANANAVTSAVTWRHLARQLKAAEATLSGVTAMHLEVRVDFTLAGLSRMLQGVNELRSGRVSFSLVKYYSEEASS